MSTLDLEEMMDIAFLVMVNLPLALQGRKGGNEIQIPLAVVLSAGLITATCLNMIGVPLLFLRFDVGRR